MYVKLLHHKHYIIYTKGECNGEDLLTTQARAHDGHRDIIFVRQLLKGILYHHLCASVNLLHCILFHIRIKNASPPEGNVIGQT